MELLALDIVTAFALVPVCRNKHLMWRPLLTVGATPAPDTRRLQQTP